ncbi:MAG: alanine racemase [Clostridiales bacterium]|nr:alanine racemase [Clostridiales bacterium]
MEKRTWAEINLDALEHNIREIRKITNPNAQIMAVVKADAYGHGVAKCAEVLLKNGADRFAVATLNEAIELRRLFSDVPILILGSSLESEADELVKNDITPNVYLTEFAKALSDSALNLKKPVKVHIKLDTGMSRIGFPIHDGDNSDVIEEILAISRMPMLEIEGIFSHFATSDESNEDYTRLQFKRFKSVCDELEARGLTIPIKHICNSAGIMMYPEYHLDMVRPGVILYGMYPSDEVDKTKLDLKYVMSLKSIITYVKEIESGRGVSYGKEYIADGVARIATVPIGYADGYSRLLANKAKIAVGEKLFPIAGRICMDQCMIDVSCVNNIKRGDEALIFGDGAVTADDIATWLGTINYEVTCMLGHRVPRVYKHGGKTVKVLEYLL